MRALIALAVEVFDLLDARAARRGIATPPLRLRRKAPQQGGTI
jgi:hypothetical protein